MLLGAFAALASFALFHLVRCFRANLDRAAPPTSRCRRLLGVRRSLCAAAGAMKWPQAGWPKPGGNAAGATMAVLIGLFSLAVPCGCLGAGTGGRPGLFLLLGLCCWGCRTARLRARSRPTDGAPPLHGRWLADLAWLGAAFAPLVALGLSARFGPRGCVAVPVVRVCCARWGRCVSAG